MAANPYLVNLFGGYGSTSTALGVGDLTNLYQQSVDNADKEKARLAKDPGVLRDLATLDKALAKAKTPEELLKNPAAQRVLLQALGLGDQTANTGLATRALLADVSVSTSLPNQLSDSRWKSSATLLDFAKSGLTKLKSADVRKSLTEGLIEYRRLTAISDKSQAVADALVIRDLGDTTPNVYTVLGNSVMRRVATTVASLPSALALQEVEAQARSLNAHFDLKEFSTEKGREKLIQKYLVMTGLNGSDTNSGSSVSGIAALFV